MPATVSTRLVPVVLAVLLVLAVIAAVVASLHGAPAVHGHEAMFHDGAPQMFHD
jgi:uncharacterized membrane protein